MKDKPRNPVARSPLMRKGGVHQPSKSGQRQQQRQEIDQELDGMLEEKPDEQSK